VKSNITRFLPILGRSLPILIRLLPILFKVCPFFERVVHVFVTFFLERALRTLKIKGSIEDYHTRIVRTSKFHYRIDIRIVLTSDQAKIILNDFVAKILGMFG